MPEPSGMKGSCILPKFPPGCPGAPDSSGDREEGRGRKARGGTETYLLSLHSFRSLTLSHLRRRKRFRRGEALGVEQLDHGVSSSLEGVISMAGSCRNSLLGAKTPGTSWASPPSRLCSCTFFVRRILKRRRRSVGVEELDQTGLPSGAPCGPATCRAGSCRFSIRLAAGMGPRHCRAAACRVLLPPRLGRSALSTVGDARDPSCRKIKFLSGAPRGGSARAHGATRYPAARTLLTFPCASPLAVGSCHPPHRPAGAPRARPLVFLRGSPSLAGVSALAGLGSPGPQGTAQQTLSGLRAADQVGELAWRCREAESRRKRRRWEKEKERQRQKGREKQEKIQLVFY